MTNTNRMFADEMRENADTEYDHAEQVIKRMLEKLEKCPDTYCKIITVRDTFETLQSIQTLHDKFIVMAEVLEDAADYDEQEGEE